MNGKTANGICLRSIRQGPSCPLAGGPESALEQPSWSVAPVLILDEATSSMDMKAERIIVDSLARYASDRTSFIVAHRLSTLRDADVIMVIENGRLIEAGAPNELIETDGYYSSITRSVRPMPTLSEYGDQHVEPRIAL